MHHLLQALVIGRRHGAHPRPASSGLIWPPVDGRTVLQELGRSNMRLTRNELGDLIQDRLTGFIFAFDKMLVRQGKSCPA